MTPWEVRDTLNFLLAEAKPTPNMAAMQSLCAQFNATWLGLWAQYGVREEGWPEYHVALKNFAMEMHGLSETLLLKNSFRFFAAFRAMIAARPERVIAVVGHGGFFLHLLGRHLDNCEVATLT